MKIYCIIEIAIYNSEAEMNRRYEKQPLKEGKLVLYIDQDCKKIEAIYYIQKIIGQGRSCLVYDASYIDNIGLEHKVRIKECYPDGIDIVRDKNGNLCVEERNQNRFSDKKKRFEEAYKLNVKIQESEDLINSTSKVRQLYYANHTIYFIFEYNMGINYEEYEEKSLESLITRMKTLCSIIEKYHNQGYLHLDIKPSNIFVLPETKENVMLFDFDSVVKIEDIKENKIERISYTEDFAALEQRTGKMKRIGKETDIYSIGAVLFYKMFGRVSDAMDREYGTDYDFCEIKEKYPELTPDFFEKLGEFFNKTLSANISNRYKQMRDVINSLTELQELCSEKRLFIESNFTYDTNSFIGREEEIDEIKQKLQSANIIFLYGIGGIGKTELAKKVTYEYMEQERKATVLFISYQNNIVDSVCSDNVEIQNLTYSDKESNEELFKRKLKIMKNLLTKKDLIIIDNFDVEFDEHLEELFECKCKFLVTTRFDFRDTYYCIKVSPFRKIETVFELFQQYNQYEYNEEEKEVLRDIFELVDRHTMTVELIAKNMRISSIDPLELREKLFTNDGITASGDIGIRFRKDRKTTKQSVEQHLKIIFDLSSFSEKELLLIRSLSLFGITKIKKALFLEWFDMNLSNDMENLIRNGWIQERESDLKISLHQVILDLVYNNLNPSSENCVEVTKAMLNYAAQKEFESYIKKQNRDQLCSIFLERITGESRLLVQFLNQYCENIKNKYEIIEEVIKICGKNNWNDILCDSYKLRGKFFLDNFWDYMESKEEQRKMINEIINSFNNGVKTIYRMNLSKEETADNMLKFAIACNSLCRDWNGSFSFEKEIIKELHYYVEKIYLQCEKMYKNIVVSDDKLKYLYKHLTEFYKIDPFSVEVWNELGDYEKFFYYDSLLKQYNDLAEITLPLEEEDPFDSLDSNIYEDAGDYADENKDYHKAIEYYHKALQEDQYSIYIRKKLAKTYACIGDLAKSIEIYGQIIEIEEDNEYANLGEEYIELGELFLLNGNKQSAMKMYQLCLTYEKNKINEDNEESVVELLFYSMYQLYKFSEQYSSQEDWKELVLFYQSYKKTLKDSRYAIEFRQNFIEQLIKDENYQQAMEELVLLISYYSITLNSLDTEKLEKFLDKMLQLGDRIKSKELLILIQNERADLEKEKTKNENYEYALELCLKSEKIIQEDKSVESWIKMKTMKCLADIYSNLFEYEKSEEYYEKCNYFCIAEHDEINKSFDEKIEIWKEAIEDYKRIENYEGAIKCYERSKDLWEQLRIENLEEWGYIGRVDYWDYEEDYIRCLFQVFRYKEAEVEIKRLINFVREEYMEEVSDWQLDSFFDIVQDGYYKCGILDKVKEYIKRRIYIYLFHDFFIDALFVKEERIESCFEQIMEFDISEGIDEILERMEDLKEIAQEMGDMNLIEKCNKFEKKYKENIFEF